MPDDNIHFVRLPPGEKPAKGPSFSMPPTLFKRLRRIAYVTRLSRSQIVCVALELYLPFLERNPDYCRHHTPDSRQIERVKLAIELDNIKEKQGL